MLSLRESFRSILRNPVSAYLRFVINWWQNQFKFKNLYQDYLSLILASQLEPNVSIYEGVLIEGSTIGSFTYVSVKTRIIQASIGKFCCIGPHSMIGLGLHPAREFVSSHPIFYSTNRRSRITFSDRDYFEEKKNIQIGNDVWIGANVVVLDGISIGDGAIIATGAVVTEDVPPYAIYGGVPAKLIRYRFDPPIIEFLLDFKWWDKEIEWLKTNFKDFHDIQTFKQNHSN